MASELEFNTPAGQTVARELLVAYLNVGSNGAPEWAPIGKRVEDSSIEMDWGTESKVDIFGDTYTTAKKATKTQTFDPWELDSSDKAQSKVWNVAIRDNDATAITSFDMLIAHFYAGQEGKNFAERYESCLIAPTNLGGEGGGSVGMAIDVTYGGTRTLGTVAKTGKVVTFTPDVEV